VKKAALAAAFCSVLMLSACGDLLPGSKDPVVLGSSAPTPDAAVQTTATPDSTPTATASASAVPVPGPTAPAGTVYTDPKGLYDITIDKRWVPYKDFSKGPIWYIDAPDDGWRPLVNVVTEPLTGQAEGISLETYLRLSERNLVKGGFTIVKRGSLRGTRANRLGAIEYAGGKGTKNAPLRFLVIIDVSRTNAAVVTMTATQKTFKQQRAAAQPYMITVQAAE
jgi:hypothetical protein